MINCSACGLAVAVIEERSFNRHSRTGSRDCTAVICTAVDKGCAKLAGHFRTVIDIQIDCPDRTAVRLISSSSGAVYKLDGRYSLCPVIHAVNRHRGIICRINRAAVTCSAILHGCATVDH